MAVCVSFIVFDCVAVTLLREVTVYGPGVRPPLSAATFALGWIAVVAGAAWVRRRGGAQTT
jgi:hypothetical protein